MIYFLRHLIFISTACAVLYANAPMQVTFDVLNTETGLASNAVECIYQDRQGYIWFGTQDGLSKYDGYSFINYKHDPDDSTTLSENIVYHVFDDGRYFWIGTAGKLNRFDPTTEKFTTVPVYGVSSIVRDGHGLLWAGSLSYGLYGINDQLEVVYYLNKDNSGLGSDSIRDLLYDAQGNLWVCTEGGGVTRISFRADSLTLVSFRHDADDDNSIASDLVTSVCRDDEGNYWFGTRFSGLDVLTKSGAFVHFRHHKGNVNTLPSNEIRSLVYDRFSKSIWVGTYENGLCRLKKEATGYSITRLKPNSSNTGIITDYTLTALFIDRFASLWQGTYHSGVYKFTLPKIKFKIYKFNNSRGLKENGADYAWSFYEDGKKRLWAGGINGISLLTKAGAPGGGIKGLYFGREKDVQIRRILKDRNGTLWAATIGLGLVRLHIENNTVSAFPVTFSSRRDGMQNLYCLAEDISNDSLLWLGSNGAGLMRYNKYSGKTKFYKIDQVSPDLRQSLGWVCAIYQDKQGVLWLGTWNNGLCRFNPKNGQMTHYYKKVNANSINNNTVLYIYSNGNGILWLGTYGGGLNRFNVATQTFRSYTTKEGLPNNIVYGIVEDDRHNLWLSTNKGIAFFRQADGSVKSFTADDGLPGNEFNLGACYKTSDGEILFGSTEGIVQFKPVEVINPWPPQLHLTALKIYGKAIKLNAFSKRIPEFHLGYKDKVLSFEFVGLHYKNSAKNQYAYMLEGLDGDWIYCGSNRRASYHNLSPGKYVFRIKAANCDGVWSEKALEIPLIIAPPFWQSPWFYLFAFIVLGLFFVVMHRIRLRQILHIETAKLSERERLRRKMAADFHDELGHRVTKISLLSKILLNSTAVQKESARRYLNQIAENADSLFAEMREFVWELDPQKDSLYDLMSQLKNFSGQLFDTTEIAFRIEGLSPELENMKLNMEWRQNLLRLFKEGMTNILKHAEGCKNVSLQIVYSDNHLQIVLSDDGAGFDMETVALGNGLKNMRSRAEKINGTLRIQSGRGKGTQIIFSGKLP